MLGGQVVVTAYALQGEAALPAGANSAWSADLSKAATVRITGEMTGDIVPAVVAPPALPMGAVPTTRVLRKRFVAMPALGDLVLGRPVNWDPEGITDDEVGRLRFVVGGKDITFFRGTDTLLESFGTVEPYGPETMVLNVTGVSPLEPLAVGDLAWLYDGANVEADLIAPDGARTRLWEGWIASIEDSISDSSMTVKLQCKGVLLQADHIKKQPEFNPTPQDIGTMLARSSPR